MVYVVDSSDPENLSISSETFRECPAPLCKCHPAPFFTTSLTTPPSVVPSAPSSGKVILHPDLECAPLLILANKQDKEVGVGL